MTLTESNKLEEIFNGMIDRTDLPLTKERVKAIHVHALYELSIWQAQQTVKELKALKDLAA
jgi:hypothetical protein